MRRSSATRLAATSVSIMALGAVVAALPGGSAIAAGSGHTPASAASVHVATPSLGKDGRVIVVLRDQRQPSEFTGLSVDSATASTAAAARAQVTAQIKQIGGRVTGRYSLINAVSARLTSAQATRLAASSAVSRVVPDAIIHDGSSSVSTPPVTGGGSTSTTTATATKPVPGACSSGSKAQLGPEALSDTEAASSNKKAKTARSLGYTGKNVTVAFMAEGLNINDPDFIRKDGKHVFTDYKDFSGDGLKAPTDGGEAFLDASAIAAQGIHTYDISHFSHLPLDRPCNVKIEGEAPGANLVGLKVFGNESGLTSGFLKAIQYAVKVDHVNVLSQSFGGNPIPDTTLDVIRAADNAAVAHGTTVTVSSGDAGITNTIGSPATDPNVISAGASTTYRFYLQSGYGGARLPGIKGWVSDNISSLSSGGFDNLGRTVTLVAPGDLNLALCTANPNAYYGCTNFKNQPSDVEDSGGTSESAPTVAGVAALVIQAYREGHGGHSPSPAVVKDILTSTAKDIDAPGNQQGAGEVDAYRAVVLAKSYGSGPKGAAATESSATEFSKVAARGTKHTFSDTLTNRGSATETVKASSRTLGAYKTVKTATVKLTTKHSKKYVDFQGITDNYEAVHFKVPAHSDRLASSIAYKGASLVDLAARDRLTLVDPSGKLAAYSLPQGIGNYGHVEVAKPEAGKWTAYIQSRKASNGGSPGKVHFSASVANYHSFGTVSPRKLVLKPGKSGTVKLATKTPTSPGDFDGSLVLAEGGSAHTTVPVTMRTLIPSGKQSFRQTLYGGNGRDEYPGDAYFYELNVKKGTPELNASIKLDQDKKNPFQAALISPKGTVLAFGASTKLSSNPISGSVPKLGNGTQLHALAPSPGRWLLEVDFAPVVSGKAISTPFTVSTSDGLVAVHARGVPDSTKRVLKPGKKVSATLTVHNSGPASESYFIDPRLSKFKTYKIKAVNTNKTTAPAEVAPQYLVPTNTVGLSIGAKTTGSKPIEFDASGPIGDPDIESTAGKTAKLRYFSSAVEPGQWGVFADEIGPFAKPGSFEPVKTSAKVKTLAFDKNVKSPTGDLWEETFNAMAPLNAVTVKPGETAKIVVEIDPKGNHHVVSGTLFLDDADVVADEYSQFVVPNGNQIAAVPYKYTVK